jgi:prepilin-type N-terminal cleavage/methylation domain-containing protein
MLQIRGLSSGFTLAELLVALAILGEIATFTIPKVLTASQNQKNNAIARETAAMVSSAYGVYTLQNQYNTTAGIANITQYMNYVAVDTSSSMDTVYGAGGTQNCSTNGGTCLKLHNGAFLQYWPADYFSGTSSTNGIPFWVDPDGRLTDTSASGTEKSIRFVLYYNGRVTDMQNIVPGTAYSNGGALTMGPSASPPWFSW